MTPARNFAATLADRGYQPLYRRGMRCPACSRGHWHVGRFSAECANCAAAIPLAPATAEPAAATLIPFRRSAAASSPRYTGADHGQPREAPADFSPLPAGAQDPEGAA
jgi:hypothetical protein